MNQKHAGQKKVQRHAMVLQPSCSGNGKVVSPFPLSVVSEQASPVEATHTATTSSICFCCYGRPDNSIRSAGEAGHGRKVVSEEDIEPGGEEKANGDRQRTTNGLDS